MSHALCHVSEIPDPGSKGFEISTADGQHKNIFVVHRDGRFHAFINRCPHTGVNLEWQQDQFLDMENVFIQCATHDALFEVDSGYCVSGPCVGDSLETVAINIDNDVIYASVE